MRPLLLALAIAVASCSGERSSAFLDQGGFRPGGDSVLDEDLFARMKSAPFAVAYEGRRRIEATLASQEVNEALSYTELVRADGTGEFAVEVEAVHSPRMSTAEEELFRLTQLGRQGFLYRYRDVHLSDLELFFANYRCRVLEERVLVAGHRCIEMEIERVHEGKTLLTLAVEPRTGLILRSVERDREGNLIDSMEFDSIELDPDFSGRQDFMWSPGSQGERKLNPTNDGVGGVPYQILAPRFLPAGFRPISSTRLDDPLGGQPWNRIMYTDGLEYLFFLHGGDLIGSRLGGQDVVSVFDFGPWLVADGELGGQRLIAVGKVSERDLLDMLQSAL
jgi:hypothetical protein